MFIECYRTISHQPLALLLKESRCIGPSQAGLRRSLAGTSLSFRGSCTWIPADPLKSEQAQHSDLKNLVESQCLEQSSFPVSGRICNQVSRSKVEA